MREIKFRALVLDDDDNTRMEYYVSLIGDKVLTEDGFYMRYTEVMQYTGFRDKKGKDVYEGDILRYSDGSDISTHWIYWDEKECRFMDERFEDGDSSTAYDGFEFVKDCRIIGNIYEHKHLLQ